MVPIVTRFRQARETPTGKVAVLIHGGGFDQRYFEVTGYAMVDRLLAMGVDVLSLNRPGHGGTPAIESEHPIADSIPILRECIERELSPGDDVAIIGHSIGGAVAIHLAATRPDWLRGITVSGIGDELPAVIGEAFKQLPSGTLATPDPARDRAIFFGPDGTFDPAVLEAVASVRVSSVHDERMEIAFAWPQRLAEVAREIRVPVQIGLADHEKLWVTSPAILDRIAGYFASSPWVDSHYLEHGGHLYEFHHKGPQLLQLQRAFVAKLLNVEKM